MKAAIAQQYQALCELCLQAAAHPYYQGLQIDPCKVRFYQLSLGTALFTGSISLSDHTASHEQDEDVQCQWMLMDVYKVKSC